MSFPLSKALLDRARSGRPLAIVDPPFDQCVYHHAQVYGNRWRARLHDDLVVNLGIHARRHLPPYGVVRKDLGHDGHEHV